MISFFSYVLFPLIIGFITSLFSNTYAYQTLVKPLFSPPGYIFPIVWLILYILLGYSSYLIKDDKKSLKIFYINLAINYIWTFVFFNLGNFFQGFILIMVMIALEVLLLIRCKDKRVFIINIIYIVWLLYAAYLSLGVYLLNR